MSDLTDYQRFCRNGGLVGGVLVPPPTPHVCKPTDLECAVLEAARESSNYYSQSEDERWKCMMTLIGAVAALEREKVEGGSSDDR